LLRPTLPGLARLTAFLDRLPRELLASLLVVCAFTIFTAMAVLIRLAAEHLAIIVVIFIRQVVTMLLMAPFFWASRKQIRHPAGLKMHVFRGITAVGAMLCGLSAIVYVPLADVTAIQMTEVLFVTGLAALILREQVGWRRWSATVIGFIGVIVMLRPLGGGVDPFVLVALLGAVFSAFAVMTLRLGSMHDTAMTVLFYQGLVVIALSGPLAYWFWTPPTAESLRIVFLMSLIMGAGQWLFTTALRMGQASALAPLNYLRLVMMATVGYWLYDEVPSLATLLGALLIMGSATYTVHRNAQRRKEAEEAEEAMAAGETTDEQSR
jgi:drug/metabolite transporter (DMT)-like permease